VDALKMLLSSSAHSPSPLWEEGWGEGKQGEAERPTFIIKAQHTHPTLSLRERAIGRDWVAPIAIFFAGLAICLTSSPSEARHREEKINPYAATPVPMAPAAPADGAIFHASAGYAPLTSGARAAAVGDVLTIVLQESTQASKSTSQKTDRSGNVGLTPPTTGPASFFLASDASASGQNSFNGKGEAAQSNQLNGQISVTIAQVYPNGTMLVRGQKILTLNRGDETINIQGIVRSADIAPDNSVLSSRVADAKITYVGKGEMSRAATQGWLQRLFTRFSPF
jgi:flagellar L-ring protein precursor FlgH